MADFGNDKGLLDKSRIFSIVLRPNGRDGKFSLGCGAGTYIHHAWSNEVYAPEKGKTIRCRAQERF